MRYLFTAALALCLLTAPTLAHAADVRVIHNSNDGLKNGKTLTLSEDLTIGVEDGDEDETFGRVSGIAIDSHGNIFVVDAGYMNVKKYDANGEFLLSFGRKGEGPGEFARPTAVAIDSDDNVYVAGSGAKVSVFRSDGTHIEDFRREIAYSYVQGIGFDQGGDFIVCSFDLPSHQILHRFGADHKHQLSFCDSYAAGKDVPPDEETFQAGGAFAVADDGAIYFTQRYPYEIRRFTPDGTLTQKILRKNDFLFPANITREGDSTSFRMGASCYRILFLHNGMFLNFAYIPNFDDHEAAETIIDLFDTEGTLLATHRLAGLMFAHTMDDKNRLYFSDSREFPKVARYGVEVR